MYSTHFRACYVPKTRYFGKKTLYTVHGGEKLKKGESFSFYYLNGYRYFQQIWVPGT